MEPTTRRGPGRPPKAPEDRKTYRIEMRTTRDIKAKIERNGGTQWLEELVRHAPETRKIPPGPEGSRGSSGGHDGQVR